MRTSAFSMRVLVHRIQAARAAQRRSEDLRERAYLRTLRFKSDDHLRAYQGRILGVERRLWRYTSGYRHGQPYVGAHACPPWPVRQCT